MAEPEEKAPGEVRHTGQAVVRLVLFAIVVVMLAGLVWAVVRMASRPAPSPATIIPATLSSTAMSPGIASAAALPFTALWFRKP